MFKLRMEQVTLFALSFSFVIWLLECTMVEGRTLDPIYWNSSNPLFKGASLKIHVSINDKLDIICPRKGRDAKEELFYFKLYLVTEENYRTCNSTGGRRLITCDVPSREKKYTFFFTEISPSPWGLEFKPDQNYYVISTSDGSKTGLNLVKGGVCSKYKMKFDITVNEREKKPISPVIQKPPVRPPVIKPEPSIHNKPTRPQTVSTNNNINNNNKPVDNNIQGPVVNSVAPTAPETPVENGLVIGIVLGACAVLFIVLLSFLGYKVYRRRRHMKKYQSPPMTPTRGSTPLQQVTLLPIAPSSHHHLSHSRLHGSEHDRHRPSTLSSHHGDMRPPPSYNESFLDTNGPVVAV